VWKETHHGKAKAPEMSKHKALWEASMKDLSKLERAFLASIAVNVLLVLALGLAKLDLYDANRELIESKRTLSRAGRSLRKCERISDQFHRLNITWGQVCLRSKEQKKVKAASSAIRKNAAASTRGKHDHRD
jgi:cell division protein FtsL